MTTPKKRVDIVSIKLVKESSVLYEPRRINAPADAVNLCRKFLEDSDREQMIAISLDAKKQPTSVNVTSVGTINSTIYHPREIFKSAILSNADTILIAHNHPSGDHSPSREDINMTKRLEEAGELLGIKLVDHIVIGYGGNYRSMKEDGVL